jgi:hypothetical protein
MSTIEPTPPRFRRAIRPITKPKDVLRVAEDHLVAIRLVRWTSTQFDGEEYETPVAEVAVVDLEDEPQLLGVVAITWKRVIRLLEISPADEWQVGRLEREPEYQAVELAPMDFDEQRVGAVLAEVVVVQPEPPAVPKGALPVGEVAGPEPDDDETPF